MAGHSPQRATTKRKVGRGAGDSGSSARFCRGLAVSARCWMTRITRRARSPRSRARREPPSGGRRLLGGLRVAARGSGRPTEANGGFKSYSPEFANASDDDSRHVVAVAGPGARAGVLAACPARQRELVGDSGGRQRRRPLPDPHASVRRRASDVDDEDGSPATCPGVRGDDDGRGHVFITAGALSTRRDKDGRTRRSGPRASRAERSYPPRWRRTPGPRRDLRRHVSGRTCALRRRVVGK